MKKLIKILFCFILIVSVLSSAPAYANYNAVYEKSLTDSGDNPIYAGIYLMINLDNDTVIFEKDADKQTATNKSESRILRNTNNLMNKAYADYYSPYAVGIKTGSTDNAGRCVISKGTGNGYNYLCVIMNAPMKNIDDDEPLENCAFVDCRRMFNWVFNHIELKSIASPTQIITEVPLKLSFRTDHISLVPGEEVLALIPTGADAGSVLIEPVPETVPKSVDAPVKRGQEICEARVLYAGEEIARIKLVANEDVSRNVLLFLGAMIKKTASSTVFKIIASIAAFLIVGYIALFVIENYKRRQRRKLKQVNAQLTVKSVIHEPYSNKYRYDETEDPIKYEIEVSLKLDPPEKIKDWKKFYYFLDELDGVKSDYPFICISLHT